MIFISRYIDKHFLVCGELSVPLQIASYQCEYKYVILNEGDDPTYEEIIEYQWKWREGRGYLNRYLDIRTRHLSENSKLAIIRPCELLHIDSFILTFLFKSILVC